MSRRGYGNGWAIQAHGDGINGEEAEDHSHTSSVEDGRPRGA
jgi:hypothetical protein